MTNNTTGMENMVLSLSDRLQQAVGLVDTSPSDAIHQLQNLQKEVATRGLLSANETVTEMSARPIRLLTIEYYLAMAFINLPFRPDQMMDRLMYLQHAGDVLGAFLSRLDQMESLSTSERKQYQFLMDLTSSSCDEGDQSASKIPPPMQRDDKIARHRARQSLKEEQTRLQSLMERRNRLAINSDEEMDGHDGESLIRTLAITELDLCKIQAIDEWFSIIRETPIVLHMIQSQVQHNPSNKNSSSSRQPVTSSSEQERPSSNPNRGLQVTHITANPMNGKLVFRKEEIRSNVLRAGWNQPTMSLQDFADRELQDAMERQASQQQAEEQQKVAPRRYEQLLRDGMEDDADLVDASADLDRRWDDWKDENPRGSGNKRGDVGDRNF